VVIIASAIDKPLSLRDPLQNWEYLWEYPKGPGVFHENITSMLQLRDNNVAMMDAYRAIYASKAHPCRSANLGHGTRQKLRAFFVQLSNTDILALSVPPTMERSLITKYKFNNGGQPVETPLYLGK
jgi:hypothetical protein